MLAIVYGHSCYSDFATLYISEAKRNHKVLETASVCIFRWSRENGKTYCAGPFGKS